MSDLIDSGELAARLGVSLQTVYSWQVVGRIRRAAKVGARVLYRWRDVQAALDAEPVTALDLAGAFGFDPHTITEWRRSGLLPSEVVNKAHVFRLDVVGPILGERRRRRTSIDRVCAHCKLARPRVEFFTSGGIDKGACRACHAANKRRARRAQAEREGRTTFESQAERTQRCAEAAAEWEREKQRREAAREAIREARRAADTLHCWHCDETMPRAEFYPSILDECRACRVASDARNFASDCAAVTDRYVRKLLTKRNKLGAKDVPQSMIEAKRAQLMLWRRTNTTNERQHDGKTEHDDRATR